jgi:hypothetical protein
MELGGSRVQPPWKAGPNIREIRCPGPLLLAHGDFPARQQAFAGFCCAGFQGEFPRDGRCIPHLIVQENDDEVVQLIAVRRPRRRWNDATRLLE